MGGIGTFDLSGATLTNSGAIFKLEIDGTTGAADKLKLPPATSVPDPSDIPQPSPAPPVRSCWALVAHRTGNRRERTRS